MNRSIHLSSQYQQLHDSLLEMLAQSFANTGIYISVVGGMNEEITVVLPVEATLQYTKLAKMLRDDPRFSFKTLIDICGIDYSSYTQKNTNETWSRRFAVITHLLSIEQNWRICLRVFATEDDFPVVDSLTSLWPAANWFEREAFDLYGIAFNHHEDLRRILTDYGFIGHPFRKDFPISGYVEMRFDPEQHRVIYQPVSIERRDIKPRAVREVGFAGTQDSMNPEPLSPPVSPKKGDAPASTNKD